jgi:hypothetical protein
VAKTNKNKLKETNRTYFLKLVLYLILGSLWVKVTKADSLQIPLPVGLAAGLLFATHEHFQIDKKIEYAVLLVSAFVGFWLPLGLYISF